MSFDPEQFLDIQVNESNSTSVTPCPEGEYTGIIEKLNPRSFAGKKDPTKTYTSLEVFWSVEDDNVTRALDKEKVLSKQTIFLDLADSGGLDMGKGKNVGLGRLREALNLNLAGQPFSFNMMVGRAAKIHVKQSPDDKDPTIIRDEVAAVTRLS